MSTNIIFYRNMEAIYFCANVIIVPLLVDPNTNVVMLESEDIKQYLIKTYQDGEFKTDESIVEYIKSRAKKSE